MEVKEEQYSSTWVCGKTDINDLSVLQSRPGAFLQKENPEYVSPKLLQKV